MQLMPAYFFDPDRLETLVREQSETFRAATPFRHVVLDDFLPPPELRALVESFPGVDDIPWTLWGPGMSKSEKMRNLNKLGQSDEKYFPSAIRHFLCQLNSATFISFLEQLTGFRQLIPDPSYNGCGLHSTGRGGRLMIHSDANRHPHSAAGLHQVLNFILYLNEDWKDEYGGHLELWTRDRKPCKKIAPVANRAVLFQTGTQSFHGHPEPIACPEGRRRNSLAVYYYTPDRVVDDDYEGMQHSPRWVLTTEADWETARAYLAEARLALRRLDGQTVRLPISIRPMNLGPSGCAWFALFNWETLESDGRNLVVERLSGLRGGTPLNGLLGKYQPFALVTDEPDADPDGDSLVALLGPDSGVYLQKSDAKAPTFACYFNTLLAINIQPSS